MKLKIAIPSKGRISDPALKLLGYAGIGLKDTVNRKLFADTQHPDISVMFTRAADIPEFVADGAADLGITGMDLILEKGDRVKILEDLKFGKANLVLASPEDSSITSLKDLKDDMVVATEFPNLTHHYLHEKGINIKIVELSGSTEIAPFIGVADLIADLSSTGTTLKMNHLKVVDTIVESSVRLIANHDSFTEKKVIIEEVLTGIQGVMEAESKKLIMLNVEKQRLAQVEKAMPGMTGPTVSQVLSNKNMVAVHAVVDEKEVFKLVNRLKKVGAKDILVMSIERIIN